jgi:dTDP-glucose 4,6-dehydratase
MDPVVDADVEVLLESNIPTDFGSSLVVTGASGMLGGYFLEVACELAQQLGLNTKIAACVRSRNPYLDMLADRYRSIVRLVELKNVSTVIRSMSNPFVIHAASPASPERYDGNAFGLIQTNISLSLAIAEALADVGGRLSFLSSGEVYGPNPPLPTNEESSSGFDHLSERGSYPESKRAGELIFKSYSEVCGFSATVLRVYHTFGPGIDLDQSRIFSTVVRSIVDSAPIVLRTQGLATRNFLYALDFVAAVLQTRFNEGFHVFNVAGVEEVSIADFARMGAELSNGNSKVQLPTEGVREESRQPPESPIMRGLADTTKLRNQGWSPLVPLKEGITKTVESALWRQKFCANV